MGLWMNELGEFLYNEPIAPYEVTVPRMVSAGVGKEPRDKSPRTCPHCGGRFAPSARHVKYCSDACCDAARKRRDREYRRRKEGR